MASKSNNNRSSSPYILDACMLAEVISLGERVATISLGCARNLVDTENILGQLRARHAILSPLSSAETVIVNTCAFIHDAKQESIDTILSLVALKKQGRIQRIIVMGCFSQRYAKIFAREFPEVDYIFGVLSAPSADSRDRVVLTPRSYAYLKISEGCLHRCSFCVIPRIKGPLRSRPAKDILQEALALQAQGFRELDIIGQDVTAYATERRGAPQLVPLLRELLAKVKRIRWLRILYAHPQHISDELLDLMATQERLCPYLDIPIQHINDAMLQAMRRGCTKAQTQRLIERIRARVPGIALRTSVIVGFPGETEQRFQELCDFLADTQFDRVGVLRYSPEETTAAAKFSGQISDKIKQERYNTLMRLQQKISRRRLRSLIGRRIDVLIDAKKNEQSLIGRTPYDAPEVDGIVEVKTHRSINVGDLISAKIIRSRTYDLVAEDSP